MKVWRQVVARLPADAHEDAITKTLVDDQFIDEFDGAVSRDQAMCAVEMAAREFVQRHERR